LCAAGCAIKTKPNRRLSNWKIRILPIEIQSSSRSRVSSFTPKQNKKLNFVCIGFYNIPAGGKKGLGVEDPVNVRANEERRRAKSWDETTPPDQQQSHNFFPGSVKNVGSVPVKRKQTHTHTHHITHQMCLTHTKEL
jgi:hypothetical protein